MLKNKIRKKIINLRKNSFNSHLNIKINNLLKIVKKSKMPKPSIGGYYPVNFEIDCLKILKTLEKNKFKISLPIVSKSNSMNFYRYSFKQPLQLNKYGIPEPNKKIKVYPDILIVPLVAFDKDLYRIGYGGGYYDRYIAKLKKKKYFITIGFAYSFQIINKVPINKFDKNLDFIITENKVYK
ncbi:MAG: 5-formyltetrahydrofolate cyclo-ligase [Candidatus Pelagibacter sp. TMED118]|nr:MAG: 5-formyltetrahydrofolate cyclo-ligase [Candidatus Pelagibacter sp. TMED118]